VWLGKGSKGKGYDELIDGEVVEWAAEGHGKLWRAVESCGELWRAVATRRGPRRLCGWEL
jgi:hypothetical protein